ncbi:MAG: RHS repeat-associated core domain-containing protein, partial [Actinomycetota bacterium]
DNGWALFDAATTWATTPTDPVDIDQALQIIANPNNVSTGDKKLQERLRRRGFDVTFVDDNAAVPALDGVSLIVISDTSVASRVRKYETVTVPIIVAEHGAWDDLGLTTANGAAKNGKNVTITNDTDLDAGLTGTIQVITGSKMTRATNTQLGADAIAVAAHTTGGQTIFAYESGTTMADGTAPARRVGFGFLNGAIQRLNANGRDLLDAAITWATSPPATLNVALVVNDAAALDDVELALQSMLTAQGHNVSVFSDTDNAPASGIDVAVIAYNANLVGSGTIDSWRSAPYGIVATRHWDFDDFGLTESGAPEAFETDNAVIVAATHPVAAGLSGTVPVVTGPWSMRTNPTGELGADATVIAAENGHTPLYVYDTGDRLHGHTNATPNTAPGRRVAFNLRDNAATRLTPDGTTILTAALHWAAGQTPPAAAARMGLAPAGIEPLMAAQAQGERIETITFAYGYDKAGNVTKITDGRNNVWTYTYNVWGLQEDVIEPSTPGQVDGRFRMIYDAGGLPAQEVLPGNVTVTSTYDQLGRRTQLSTPGQTAGTTLVEQTNYDKAGRLVSVSHPDGAVTFTYNDAAMLVGTNGPTATTVYNYDAAGRLEQRRDEAGVWNQTWTPDGRLDTIVDPTTGVTTDYGYQQDRLTTVAYGGQVGTRTYTYDEGGRLDGDVWVNPSGTVWSADYGYDRRGNVTSKTVMSPGHGGAGQWTYGYDEASRLTSWSHDGRSHRVGWDANGNRVFHDSDVAVYDARNRIVSSPDGTHVWEPRGTLDRVDGPAGADYTFDNLGRLVAVTGGAGGAVTIDYDGLDRIASRNSEAFGYNGGSIDPVAIGDDTYGRTPGGNLLSTNENTAAVAVRDRHGDVVATINTNGTIASTTAYDPFGEPIHTSGDTPALGFQADYTDPTTGDVWMGARWYDPTNAQFRSRDTIFGELATPISLNRYTYAHANPINMWDPDGRDPEFYGDEELERVIDRSTHVRSGRLHEDDFRDELAQATLGRPAEALAILEGDNVVSSSGTVAAGDAYNEIVSQYSSIHDVPWEAFEIVVDLIEYQIQPDSSYGPGYLMAITHPELYARVVDAPQLSKTWQGTDWFANTISALTPLEGWVHSCYDDLISFSCGTNTAMLYAEIGLPLVGTRTPGVLDDAVDEALRLRNRADELLGPSDNVVVLGRQWDTEVALDWPGHTVLDADDWSMPLNEAFIERLIEQERTVYLASPVDPYHLVQTSGDFAGQPSIFAHELAMLIESGYERVGNYLVPPR